MRDGENKEEAYENINEVEDVSLIEDESLKEKEKQLRELIVSSGKNISFERDFMNDEGRLWYEMENSVAMQFPGMTEKEYAMLVAGMVCVWNIHKEVPFTQEEIDKGIMFSVPIKDMAALMGYKFNNPKSKNFYKVIRDTSVSLRSSTCVIESGNKDKFLVYGPVDMVVYNPENDGNVYMKLSSVFSAKLIGRNREIQFVKNSLEIGLRASSQKGSIGCNRLYEMLNRFSFRVRKSSKNKNDTGLFRKYVDYVDLGCSLNLINIKDKVVREIVTDKRYWGYEENLSKAYERKQNVLKVNKMTTQEYKNFKKSDEYVNVDNNESEVEITKIKSKHDELRDAVTWKYCDFAVCESMVLKPVKKVLDECCINGDGLCDFTFVYEKKNYKKSVIGVVFTIISREVFLKMQGIESDSSEDNGNDEDEGLNGKLNARKVTSMPSENGESKGRRGRRKAVDQKLVDAIANYYYTRTGERFIYLGLEEIIALSKICNGDVDRFIVNYEYSSERYMKTKGTKDEIIDPYLYLKKSIQEDYGNKVIQKNKNKESVKNGFNDFEQRDYNFEELENKLLSN